MYLPITNLHRDLYSSLVTWRTLLTQARQQVGDIIPRMSIQASAETFLIQVMGNETDASAQHEETVQHTHVEVIFGFFGAEGTAVAHEVHEADSYTTVDVQDQVVFLAGGDGLDGDSVIKHLAAGEALLDEFFDELDTEIRVVAGFNLMTDTGNWYCQ